MFEILAAVPRDADARVQTPDGQAVLVIPAETFFSQGVQVRVRNLPSAGLPAPPSGVNFVRGIQLDTIINGFDTDVPFRHPVTLLVPLTAEDQSMAGGDASRLRVLRYNDAMGQWQALATRYQPEPPPGYLETVVPGFSFFAIAAPQQEPGPEPSPTTAPEPTTHPQQTPTVVDAGLPPGPPASGDWTLAWPYVAGFAMAGLALVGAAFWRKRYHQRGGSANDERGA